MSCIPLDVVHQVGIKNGAKVLLIGSSQADIAAAKPADAGLGSKDLAWDAPKVQEDITKQPQHAKVWGGGEGQDSRGGGLLCGACFACCSLLQSRR
jgi:hypothetical protein